MSTGDLAVDVLRRIAVEPVTRSSLAKEMGLAPSTISAKINDLMEAGLVAGGRRRPLPRRTARAAALDFLPNPAAWP